MSKNGNGREFTLKNGKALTLNAKGLTWGDVMKASAALRHAPECQSFYCRISGLSQEELDGLEYDEGRELERAIWRLINNPLAADPN